MSSKPVATAVSSRIRLFQVLVLLPALVANTPLGAQTLRLWPGAAPCDASFESCLAAVPAGGTLRIVSNQTIADRIGVERALSIEAAPGVTATFTATQGHTILIPGSAPWAVTLRNLRFVGGSVFISIAGSQPGELHMEALSFRGNASNAQTQVMWQFDPGTSARSRIVLRRCDFEIGSDNGAPFSISQFGGSSGGMEVIVEDNRFRPEPVVIAQSFHRAWFANVDGDGPWDIVFRRNRVLPAALATSPPRRYASGVEINTTGNASIKLAVHDNLFLLDQVAGAGGAAISAGGSSGSVQARVINNTIVNAYLATSFRPNVSGRYDNNIAANNFRLHDGEAAAANFQRRGNLEFGNAFSNWPTAPGTLTVDPQLAADGQPLPTSPSINAGNDVARGETGPGAQGQLAALDAQGLRRIEGAHVDIGAFEGERIYYDGAE